jgi:hypothetical protein
MEETNMPNTNLNNEDWSGWLVRPKPEWTNPGESPAVYVVIEDRGPRVLLQMLPQYAPKNFSFGLPVEAGLKDWYEVIDKEIQNR